MPRILELKAIDGELWARIGAVGQFPSGVSLFTPEEVRKVRYDECLYILDLIMERRREHSNAKAISASV